jgi:hypothetical protein
VVQVRDPDDGTESDGKDHGGKEQGRPKQNLLETIHLQAGDGHAIASEDTLMINSESKVRNAWNHARV